MNIKILSVVIIALLVLSCGKESTIHIKAINPVTGAPYAGLQYGITATKTTYNGEKKVFEETGFLNENGEAFVAIKVRDGRTYNVGTTKPLNTCYVKDYSFSFGKEDEANPTFQFEYAECANIKLDIENINCASPADKMNFQFKNSYSDYNGWSTDRLGCYSYDSDYFEIPSGWIIYQWKVDRSGIITNFMDSIFIGAGGQGTFVMNY
jgi:hypothetical protein